MTSPYYQQEVAEESLLSRFDPRPGAGRLKDGIASLISSEETDPDPEAFARSSTSLYSTSVDVDRPEKATEQYWVEYKQNPIIATQVWGLVSDVLEAGYWVTADSSETEDEIEEFLSHMGIRAGHTHRSFPEYAELTLEQYLVRGTFLGEKVKDDQDRHVALNPVNPTTMEIYTKPGQNLLVSPDYKNPSSDTMLKQTHDGNTAAYVQYDSQFTRWADRDERRFARDEMIHWARRPDIGELRGRSIVEPVLERSRALREKLQDNDLAIAMKAWPMILFQAGTPEHPWTKDELEDFLADYTEKELGPGMFQGVPGDIEVHEFAGETADIEGHVQTDVDYIVSGMPGPTSHLGAFMNEGTLGQSEIQNRQYRKRVRALRNDLENIYTPYLRDVAESWGYDSSDLELHVGRPDDEVAPEDVKGNTIRYESDAGDDDDEDSRDYPGGANPSDDDDDTDSSSDGSDEQSATQTPTQTPTQDAVADAAVRASTTQTSAEHARDGALAQLGQPGGVPEQPASTDELGDPRTVSTIDVERDLGDEVRDVLLEARDTTFEILELRSSPQTCPKGEHVAAEFEAQVGSARRDGDLVKAVETAVREVYDRTLSNFEQQSHSPHIAVRGHQHESLLSQTVETILTDLQDIATEMAVEMRRQTDSIELDEYGVDAIEQRIRDVWDDNTLGARPRLLARMRLNEQVNRVKLATYRNHEGVDGIKIISACGSNTHSLTADIAGCDGGESAVALFDDEQTLGEQLQAQTTIEPPMGFDPLPDVPPFHFNDRSEIAPVVLEQD